MGARLLCGARSIFEHCDQASCNCRIGLISEWWNGGRKGSRCEAVRLLGFCSQPPSTNLQISCYSNIAIVKKRISWHIIAGCADPSRSMYLRHDRASLDRRPGVRRIEHSGIQRFVIMQDDKISNVAWLRHPTIRATQPDGGSSVESHGRLPVSGTCASVGHSTIGWGVDLRMRTNQ